MANNKYVGNDGLLEFGIKFLEKLKTLFGWAEGSKLMSADDKSKLDNIAPNATAVTVDSALSSTSTNPVQNKVINSALGNKVDKVSGKGLSTNDFTTAEKEKLAGITAGATKITVDDALSSTSTNPVQNKVINTALAGKVSTETGKGLSTNDYTTADKNKLSGVASGAQVNVIETVKVNNTALTPSSKAVDITVATGSTNGTLAVNGSDVAVKGLGSAAYTNSNAYATAAQGTAAGTALQSLSKTDGTYVKLTVSKSGTAGSITVNDAAIGTALNAKADASSVPTKTSELTNDAGFITEADIPEGAAASTTDPLMDGEVAVGTSNAFARGDHRHPSDTSKQDVITSTNKLSADLIADGTTNKAYTATEKNKLAGIATGAEVNVVKSVNTTAGTSGINLSNTNGTLDVTITAGSVANNNNNFVTGGAVYTAINNAVGSVYKYKGTKATYSALPTSGNVTGDVWNVEADFTIGSGTSAKLYPAGTNVAWNGSAWDPLGGITYSFMTDTEVTSVVDTIFA